MLDSFCFCGRCLDRKKEGELFLLFWDLPNCCCSYNLTCRKSSCAANSLIMILPGLYLAQYLDHHIESLVQISV
ncbi:hypothetical protein Sjap_020935 [Stephania japonica]|uniref:Uncharacterized protein n=1 Tax=Stephania japonica TaxID=461633 RepID=A0AAP0I0P3_9MAGN